MADYSAWHKKTYEIAADDLMQVCINTIENMKKGRITKGDLHMGQIEATIGYGGFFLPGKDSYSVVIEVTPEDTFTSEISLEVFMINGYGKKIPVDFAGNLKRKSEQKKTEFVTDLEKRIQRFQLKYG